MRNNFENWGQTNDSLNRFKTGSNHFYNCYIIDLGQEINNNQFNLNTLT